MGVDSFVRRHHALLVGLCIMVAAYVQAWALRRLLASEMTRPRLPGPTAPAKPDEPVDAPRKSAAPILENNPFDSLPGTLDRVLVPPAAAHGSKDPACQGVRVVLIAAAASPKEGGWSFAALAGADGSALLRREGDEIDGRTVVGIGPDDVWLAKDGERCRARLGAPGGIAATPARPAASAPSPAMEAELTRAVRRSPDGSIEIDRAAVPALRDRALELTRGVRIVPETTGIRLFGIRKGSLLDALGLENGDRIEKIGNASARDPTALLGLLARATDLSELPLETVRRGAPRTTTIRFR